jgi:hypothetical protein
MSTKLALMDENITEKATVSTPILATKKLGTIFLPESGGGLQRIRSNEKLQPERTYSCHVLTHHANG